MSVLTSRPDATRTAWARDQVERNAFETMVASSPSAQPSAGRKWAEKLGPAAPLALVLAKGKAFLGLFNLKFLLGLGATVGVYWGLFGAKFGIGFALLMLFHEMGHFIDVKRRGLPADMPVFLPGLGAYVRWNSIGVPLATRAEVSLAGPLAGWLASAFCVLVWWKTGSNVWAALARASAWLNVLNLVPVWALDGGQAALALSKLERYALACAGVALWLLVGENVFLLVFAGAFWRLFTKDLPAQPSRAVTAYFIALLGCLALILHIVPGKGFGTP